MASLSNAGHPGSYWVKRYLAKAISLSPELFKVLRLGRKGQNGKPDTPQFGLKVFITKELGPVLYNLALIKLGCHSA